MHKKIADELVSLANSILQLENKDDVLVLHKKAQEVYEKLTVLKFVNNNISNTILSEEAPIISKKVEEIAIETPKVPFEEEEDIIMESSEIIDETAEKLVFEEKIETIEEIEGKEIADTILEVEKEIVESIEVIEEFEEELILDSIEDNLEEEILIIEEEFVEETIIELVEEKEISLFEIEKVIEQDGMPSLRLNFEEEFKDAVSADIATSMFEKVTKESPVFETKKVEEVKKRSINDVLYSTNIQVGLNDRIAFVKHLFDGSQEDFNRVLSQLNSFKSADEALEFINDFVKPDYNWNNKEDYEERFIAIIERKFS
ncbi:MAG: hypothetical protein KBE41_08305 [Lutibacter sp.]|nr:hypothetical protein [Lutibacter sp.]